MVKLRLARAGAKKRPFYRVVVADSRNARDGRFIEQIGIYDPLKDPAEFRIKKDRLTHWLGQGAQATQPVRRLILRHQKEEQVST
jgi:small subunit ribosomal protein S16